MGNSSVLDLLGPPKISRVFIADSSRSASFFFFNYVTLEKSRIDSTFEYRSIAREMVLDVITPGLFVLHNFYDYPDSWINNAIPYGVNTTYNSYWMDYVRVGLEF